MQQLQRGNEGALDSLLKEFYPSLYNYGFKFCQDDSLVKDCIQEVFISLWQRRDTAFKIVSIKYYLLRAIKNKVLKALHSLSRTIHAGELAYFNQFEIEFSTEHYIIANEDSKERIEKVKRILADLTSRQKEIVYLKFYEQLDNRQIAELMNISHQSVYNLLYESLNKLKTIWKRDSLLRVV